MITFKLDKLEVHGINPALRGMRNPLESHRLNDSTENFIGENDMELAIKLIKAGPSHRKFLRQIMIWVDITACLKWWDEFDTYLHTVKNSTSQMHKLGSRVLTQTDFCEDIPQSMLNEINKRIEIYQKDKTSDNWRGMINLIPQSFLYTRTTMMSYECFLTMFPNRKNHKMIEWRLFCQQIMEEAPYMKTFIEAI